jgi:hypothetical protein
MLSLWPEEAAVVSKKPSDTGKQDSGKRSGRRGAGTHPPGPGGGSWDQDPAVLKRLRALLASPTYRQADQDVDFLARDESRPVRLLLDYMKPELGLEEAGVEGTIVVFGSTRIGEPEAQRERLRKAKAALAKRPADADLRQQVAVARRLMAKSRYYEMAREFSRLVCVAGEGPSDGRLMIITGGGPGIMEAANRGAYEVGGRSIGLNITLPLEQNPNPYITPELCFLFHYFALRKLHFFLRAKALVAFPGGYGTFDEVFDALTLVQTLSIPPLPIVLVGEEWWRKAFDVDFLVEEGVIAPEDRDLFGYAESAQAIWEKILRWYEVRGTELVPRKAHRPGSSPGP